MDRTENTMNVNGNGKLRTQGEPIVRKLAGIKDRLIGAKEVGRSIADDENDDDETDRAWKEWTQSLPPLAFGIAREMKELVYRIDILDGEQRGGGGDDDFS